VSESYDMHATIEVMEVATPLTIKGYTLNPKGTIFGWDLPTQSTMNRLSQQTPISSTSPGRGPFRAAASQS
jgi:hypothetical protein